MANKPHREAGFLYERGVISAIVLGVPGQT